MFRCLHTTTLISALAAAQALAAGPLTETLTYQGHLTADGVPVNGTIDVAFELWDSETGGLIVGDIAWIPGVPVVDGVFTADVEFPAPDFSGDERWLSVMIANPSGSPVTPLAGRQPIRATPYALHALSAERTFDESNGDYYVYNRVGIRTASPDAMLEVVAEGGAPELLRLASLTSQTELRFTAEDSPASKAEIQSWNGFPNDVPKDLLLNKDGGNVGIGTASPDDTLDVAGTIDAGGYKLNGTPLTFSAWDTNGNDVYYNGGNVGIGTASPANKLEVDGTLGADAMNVGVIAGSQGMVIDDQHIDTLYGDPLMLQTQSGANIGIGGKVGIGTSSPGNFVGNSKLDILLGHVIVSPNYGIFSYHSSGSGIGAGMDTTPDDKVVFYANGSAQATLEEVNGRGRLSVDELLIIGGADLAEPFDVRGAESIEPGMVVAIDPANPGALRLADSAYDSTVAGVISGAGGVQPGLTLQQAGTLADGEHPVALTGRVYVRVDAGANGAIVPGDLLTTSDTPGHAMKATDHQRAFGTIIGKAMTGLDTGTGLVLVLVNLQ